jgi:hypothetical protein
MSQPYKAAVTTVAGSVYLSLPNDLYMNMTPEQARRIATRLFVLANEAEGLPAPEVIVFQTKEPNDAAAHVKGER